MEFCCGAWKCAVVLTGDRYRRRSLFLALSVNKFWLEWRIGSIGLVFLRPALQPRPVGIFVDIARLTEQRQRPEGQGFGEIDNEITFKNGRAYILDIRTEHKT